MAKELPFFKFDISAWMLGRIQKQPLEVQGAFINLCCRYWHKLGEYTFEEAKLDFGDEVLSKLSASKIIRRRGKLLGIEFLDEQLNDRKKVSSKNRQNGIKSAEIRATRVQRISTTVERPLTTVERNSTEERREEKKREEESERREEPKTRAWFESCIDSLFRETLTMTHKGKNIDQAISEAWIFLSADKLRLKNSDSGDVKKLVNTWMGNMKPDKQVKAKSFNLSDL